MALLTLQSLLSKRRQMLLMTGLILVLASVFANDLDDSVESPVSEVKVGESHVIQEVSALPVLEVAPEVSVVPSDEQGNNAADVANHDSGYDETDNDVRPVMRAPNGEEVNTQAVPVESLGPVITVLKTPQVKQTPSNRPNSLLEHTVPWFPAVAPMLEGEGLDPVIPSVTPKKESNGKPVKKALSPAKKTVMDEHPKRPRIAILIDDLGYNRHGMESSLILPKEVALAILPSTPFARKTALGAQQQGRVTLLHAPMENQRELKLGPGGLYAKMSKQELQLVLNKDIDGLPGIQGVNNHMGSLLTTQQEPMGWVMETLHKRSLFFIDSLTSPKSVARKTAENYGLKTVSRDVFLDNIRTEKAIDRQFDRLVKLARRHGSALAIGHPYPETMAYLKKRLQGLQADGVQLVPLVDVLLSPKTHSVTAKTSPVTH